MVKLVDTLALGASAFMAWEFDSPPGHKYGLRPKLVNEIRAPKAREKNKKAENVVA